ncbi:RagB/SusD family nutrient uptake outer membrane protein [Sphingobacterium sp. LRF_L2]|uniref:RagB/SusD family nutrient uptake outer membrane protein n=1 Tax=Sphingobacterium sp. LRF_L2 TaxID=3369421 RepID=UPI003F61D170
MIKNTITFLGLLSVLFVSCNKWLDVKPENQKTSEEQFNSYSGFADALNGCYILLKDQSIYGEKLTMSNIESLAQLWDLSTASARLSDYELSTFDFEADNAKASISEIYAGLYTVIAHANMIIANMETKGDVISDESTRQVLLGEAYAIRAFCHFDVLRLFGQLPNNPSTSVSLPYSETVSAKDLPTYYSYSEFVNKIESDLSTAETLLYNNDPIFKNSFSALNTVAESGEDDFLRFRQNRFNYWAVKAIKARFYLYTGNITQANSNALEILNAIGADGAKLISLSGTSDIQNGYLALPSECLLMLNVHNIMDYTPDIFGYGADYITTSHLLTTPTKLNTLFSNQGIASNNRYQSVWAQDQMNFSGTTYATLKKFYHNSTQTATIPVNISKRQIVPLIRLSEIYLIVMETTENLGEANALWQEYQLSHNVQVTANVFSTLESVRSAVLDEYRREFFGEGQMFYTYKRMGSTSMLFNSNTITESNYLIPLPDSEFNSNND